MAGVNRAVHVVDTESTDALTAVERQGLARLEAGEWADRLAMIGRAVRMQTDELILLAFREPRLFGQGKDEQPTRVGPPRLHIGRMLLPLNRGGW